MSEDFGYKKQFKEEYDARAFTLNRIAIYMKMEIECLLHSQEIPFLTTSYRIKEFDSFIEKIDRKEYSNPFDQTEDFCGLRIICYYRNDVIKISEILEKEFNIHDSFNKEDLLKENEFGYRSFHLIGRIPESRSPQLVEPAWCKFKFEIQIRTVLMHAWAEIQHKLAYKNEDHIDISMRKEFAFLSAKLEESDYQFERLKHDSDRIQKEFRTKTKKQLISNTDVVNLDSLRAILQSKYPDRKEDIDGIRILLDQLKESHLGLNEVLDACEKSEDYILTNIDTDSTKLTRSGIIRTALNLINDNFWHNYLTTIDLEKYADWVNEKKLEREEFKKNI